MMTYDKKEGTITIKTWFDYDSIRTSFLLKTAGSHPELATHVLNDKELETILWKVCENLENQCLGKAYGALDSALDMAVYEHIAKLESQKETA